MIAIAKSTLKETLRKKVLILIGIITLLYLGLLVLVMSVIQNEAGGSGGQSALMEISVQVTSVIGFYFSSMLVAFMTILLSTGVISSELESGILQAILARPLSRGRYYLGKYLGYAGIVTAFSTFMYLTIIVVSLVTGMPFMQMVTVGSIFGSWFLFVLEPLLLLAISMWLGISLRSIAGAILMGGLFVMSMIGNLIGSIGNMAEKPVLEIIGQASVLVAPFDAIYRKMSSVFFAPTDSFDMMNMMSEMTGQAAGDWVILYALVYLAAALFLGIRKFNKKDL